ncbi:Inositol-tetrakisphosphate 1-kinase 2 [Triticum urartu]|uniref:inositol-1,3,4-trisphosphate 5/6-kinase n=1 Tax=Triticum urartu TaxID=4572 RepID=M7ZFQ9_TRIUA|nr:Inositol-tetrakisphosphate 1-kinase 2 [Triticum urartu]
MEGRGGGEGSLPPFVLHGEEKSKCTLRGWVLEFKVYILAHLRKFSRFVYVNHVTACGKKGISFISIDETRPLSEQGPFDIILHKKTSKEWQRFLEDYHEVHPEVTVLDPPNAIEHLNNRQSMLEEVADLNLSSFYVAKPLVVDGTSKSHELSLAYDEASLPMLDPPLVLQEFVNHGGILFKVYIIGEAIQVVRRFSLPDVNTYDLLNNVGIYRLPRVSCAAASADHADLDPRIAELPPRPLLEKLGRELRGRLGLRLFNIDMIRELGANDRYYIIDINYFPGQFNTVQVGVSSLLHYPRLFLTITGYGKMPGYEHIFTDFLQSLGQNKYQSLVSNAFIKQDQHHQPTMYDIDQLSYIRCITGEIQSDCKASNLQSENLDKLKQFLAAADWTHKECLHVPAFPVNLFLFVRQ